MARYLAPDACALPQWPTWAALSVCVAEQQEWMALGMTLLRQDAMRTRGLEEAKIALGVQVHGDHVATLDRRHPLFHGQDAIRLPRTDAIALDGPGVAAGVLTADCVPVVILDTRLRRMAFVHAGWRGTMHRIVAKTLRVMLAGGGHPEAFQLWIGPCIRQPHYEVDEALAGRFARAFPQVCGSTRGRHLDLAAINIWQARALGVPAENIQDCGVDVFPDPDYPSYRRDGEVAGRILTWGGIRDQV